MAFTQVALATIRQNVFSNLFALIDANKPSGWTLTAMLPEDEAVFPTMVLNSASIKPIIITMDKDGFIVEDIEAVIEFWVLAKDGDKKAEEGRDNVQNTLLNNQSTLETYGLYLKQDPFDDSNIDPTVYGREKVRQCASIIRLGAI